LKLLKTLGDVKTVALDTAPLIYYIEEHKDYIEIIDPLFIQINQGHIGACTSVITLIEVLTKPIEAANKILIGKYEEILTNTHNLTVIDIDKSIAIESAKLRAKYTIRTPDAIQMVVGIMNGAKAFITNDHNLKKVKEIRVIVLNDFVMAAK